MATIGVFKKSGSEIVGDITTLNILTKNVRIAPEHNRPNDIAPTHRIFAGNAEIGAAWSKKSSDTLLSMALMAARIMSASRASRRLNMRQLMAEL